jgi:hypothetical protein
MKGILCRFYVTSSNSGWPLAAAITILAGSLYVTVQQSIRLGANMPQVQMAEDAALALASNPTLEEVLPAGKVDIALSQAPYLIIFNAQGFPIGSTGFLQGAIPALPKGVFDTTRLKGEDRISWQPEPGVRSAAVIVPVSGGAGGFVLAGRSLREAEKLIDTVTLLAGIGWGASMLVTLGLVAFFELIYLKYHFSNRS